jgi:hypothetical protein
MFIPPSVWMTPDEGQKLKSGSVSKIFMLFIYFYFSDLDPKNNIVSNYIWDGKGFIIAVIIIALKIGR